MPGVRTARTRTQLSHCALTDRPGQPRVVLGAVHMVSRLGRERIHSPTWIMVFVFPAGSPERTKFNPCVAPLACNAAASCGPGHSEERRCAMAAGSLSVPMPFCTTPAFSTRCPRPTCSVSRPAATYRSVATRWNATGSRCWCEPLRETCRVYTLGDPMEESPGRLLCDPPAVSPCVLTASHPHPHLCEASVKGRVHAPSDIRDFHPIASPHRDASRPYKLSVSDSTPRH